MSKWKIFKVTPDMPERWQGQWAMTPNSFSGVSHVFPTQQECFDEIARLSQREEDPTYAEIIARHIEMVRSLG